MNTTEIRNGFDEVIRKAAADGRDTAKLEVAREFFANPEFRTKLEQFTWEHRR